MKTTDLDLIESKKKEGFRVYQLQGIEERVVAKKGGPTYEQIKNSPSYKVLRKNQREFGVASMMAKEVRQSLPAILNEICESYISGKLTARFRKLAQKVKGDIGSRPLLVSQYGKLLEGFEFNSRHPFKKVFKANFLLKPSSTRGRFIFHFPSYIPELKINAPTGSTHYKLFAHLIAISDFQCQGPNNPYRAVDPENQGRSTTLKMDTQPLCRIPLEPFTTHIAISNGKDIPVASGLILLMGIQFYRYQSTRYHKIQEGNALQIYEVY